MSEGKGQKFDTNIYGDSEKDNYLSSLPTADEEDALDVEDNGARHPSSRQSINAPKELLEVVGDDGADDASNNYREQYGSGLVNTRIADRESEVGVNCFY